jgi:hypothetical protein
MRTITRLASGAAALALAATTFGGIAAGSPTGGAPILQAPVAGSQPTDPALFGATPGGAPWTLDNGSLTLRADGRLDVKVVDLIIPTRGDNPLPQLSASVVCNGVIVATTAPVPFSTDGDARIRTQLTLPERCLAPAILIHPNANTAVFIGATGTEA